MPKIVWEMKVLEFGGGVLSTDVLSEDEGGGVHLIAVGTMSGDLVILRGKVDGEIERLASTKCHTKYLHRCIWACSHLVSAGHDQSISVSKYHDGQIDLVKRIQFGFAVNDMAFHHPSNSLIVALKDSYSLRLIDLPGFLSGPGDEDEAALMLRCEKKVSLNEKEGDTHVSSSAKFLSLSSDGRFLGVCTDSTRVLVLRIEVGKDWRLSRTLFITSHQTDPFHTPSLAWHYDSNYLYIASGAGGGVQVLHLGSGKIFCTISAHEINVRDMTYDLERRELITCSFDKTVKVWGDKKKGNLHENLLSGATPAVLDNLSM